jgi:hypothetical protein
MTGGQKASTDADATKNLLSSAQEDASDAFDDLGDGEF